MRLETLAAVLLVVLISPEAAAQQTTDRPGQVVDDDAQALSSCQGSDQEGKAFGDVTETLFTGRGSSLVHCVGGPAANVHNLGYVLANVLVLFVGVTSCLALI